MEPVEAARILTAAARVLSDDLAASKSVFIRWELVKRLAAVTARMEPAGAARTLSNALAAETDSVARRDLVRALVSALLGVRSDSLEPARDATLLAVGTSTTPRNLLPLLQPHFQPPQRPLPPHELVKLLKHPLFVGEARRAVLDALEVTYNRPFKDHWEFAEYAQKHQPHLDLLSRPKRPHP
jgi:hypothetical protein